MSQARIVEILNGALAGQSESAGAVANQLREEGNAAFKAGDYSEAYRLYTESLDTFEDYRTFANRAAVLLKQGAAAMFPPGAGQQADGFGKISATTERIYDRAAMDALRATELKPDFAKAWYRQAKAQVGLRDLCRARMDAEEGLKACPGNAALQSLRAELVAIGVDMDEVRIANHLSGAAQEAFAQVQAGAPFITCPYCTRPVPTGGASGYDLCPYCAADPTRTDIDQSAIHRLIRKC